MLQHPTDTHLQTVPGRFCAFAAALLALTATPASAWTILADIDPDGNTLFGPADLAGTGRPNKNKVVSVNYTSAYPPPIHPVIPGPTFDEIVAGSRVDIRVGSLRGDSHAAGYDNNVLRQIVANASLQETVTTSNLSAGQWAVATAVFGGSGGISNQALSAGTFSLRVNDTFMQSFYSAAGGWSYPSYSDANPNSFAVIDAYGGGFRVELHVLIPSNRQLVFDSSVRSESRATGRISTGPSLSSQNTLAHLYLTLPTGVGYSSTSGVFLADAGIAPAVPEPGSWALMLAGAAAIGWRARRTIGTATTR